MVDDVDKVLRKCNVCQRNDRATIVHHPALALEVNGIFDRVVDLVFGFETTVEGFKGILTITEYLSNFIVIYPIKSKEAIEIAFNLRNFISFFGPSNCILSDLGLEFNNEIVDSLLNNLGIDHDVTSGWNPTTNGKQERLNRVIFDTLRRLSENDTSKWN